ncbi:MAG: hypothetical protein ALECFALPRED_003939 [Alectoria fallacina]|uniref:Asl1-like glycosyl hydrolase catalytic domain-containing protein n=1 Tax=Alectoria fallacina TaxID=1903189 RepID=A0A8H3FS38_9LECA|nr:MAG: hypothetical protein ALECFALPRED_003939 [Alectoria fallacina]
MHFLNFVLTLGLAFPGVQSIPAPSKPLYEVGSTSKTLHVARALPSGDLYPPQPPGAGPGKRGLLYNSDSNVEWSDYYVENSYVTYGTNGDVIRGDEINTWFSYVPTITVDAKLENGDWNHTVPILIEGGTKAMFASNEPDNPSQANLTPSQCVTVYKKFMQPYYGTVQLGTPAVNCGGGQAGLTYLEDFVQLCTGCAYNFVNLHYFVDRSQVNVTQYIQGLKDCVGLSVPAVQAKHEPLVGLPIVIGEFWLTGASEDEAGDLMDELLPWLDSNANVLFYQAFGGLLEGGFVNAAGTGLTPAGKAYGKLAT